MTDSFKSLSFCTNRLLQKFTSIGTEIDYLRNWKECLLRGPAILIYALTIIIMAPSLLVSSEKSKIEAAQIEKTSKKFTSRIANGKSFSEQTLLNEELILKFLSSPKARSLILEGRKKLHNLALDVYPEVQRFGEAHSSCPEVQRYVKNFEVYCRPFPYEEVAVPFLCLGIADTSALNDPVTIKEIQAFQVRIFKYWLSLYQIGGKDKYLLKDMLDFCRTSSLDVFSKLIKPILESFFDEEDATDGIDHYDVVIGYFIDSDWADYEEEQMPDNNHSWVDSQKIQQIIAQQLDQHFAEWESRQSPGEKLVEAFEDQLKRNHFQARDEDERIRENHFSRDAIISMFLEIAES